MPYPLLFFVWFILWVIVSMPTFPNASTPPELRFRFFLFIVVLIIFIVLMLVGWDMPLNFKKVTL